MTMPISSQIDHIDAAIIGIEHAIELNRGRKRPDDMDGVRQIRLIGFKEVRRTLALVQAHEPAIRDLIKVAAGSRSLNGGRE